MGERIQFKPGAAIGYFAELEEGRADVAIKSCWPDRSGRVNCQGQTLDGLLDWDTGRPRSLWYTWRAYADGRASRVPARSSDERIPVLASARSRRAGEAQLLIGNTGASRRQMSARLCGLRALAPPRKRPSAVTVRVERHPATEEAVFTPSWSPNSAGCDSTESAAARSARCHCPPRAPP